MSEQSMLSTTNSLAQMLTGYWYSQSIFVAAKLELSDHLAAGPLTAEQVATKTGAHAPSLYRLLRALASLGLYREDETQRFSLAPLGKQLCRNAPGSVWAWAMLCGDEHYGSWGELLHCIRTGERGFDKVYGTPIFDYYVEHAEAATVFDAAMTAVHGAETAAMLDVYDFSDFSTLVDIGGGNGSLLVSTLKRHPKLRGIVFDLPAVAARAKKRLVEAGLSDRAEVVSGSFFEEVVSGGDAYLMRHIIHDWTDEQSRTILRNCHRAMSAEAKLLLVEAVIPPGNDPSFAKMLDLNMLVVPGGKERTEPEYRELLTSAGFRLTRIVPTKTEMSVIEAVKV